MGGGEAVEVEDVDRPAREGGEEGEEGGRGRVKWEGGDRGGGAGVEGGGR